MIGLSKLDQTKRNGRLKEKPLKDSSYMEWLHNSWQLCFVCGNPNIEVHHLESGSRGRRDDKCVTLCPVHHRGRFSPHGADAKEFYEKYTKTELKIEANKLYQQYKEENDGF